MASKKSKKRKKTKIKNIKMLVLLGTITCFLLIILIGTSYELAAGAFDRELIINEVTSKYISFNYAQNEEQLYKIKRLHKVNDKTGKKLESFSFSVFESEADSKDSDVEYKIILIPANSFDVSNEYIKVYLTDDKDKEVVPVTRFSDLKDSIDGKILYEGKFTDDVLEGKYKLRIWLDKSYTGRYSEAVAYRVQITNK